MDGTETLKIGDKAPDFALKDQNSEEVHLSGLKGKKILLSWHPLAWTGICAKQMHGLERKADIFRELNTVALGLSVDTIPSKHAWAKELNITKIRLLSDFWPHGKTAQVYGIFREVQGTSKRVNIILDEDGTIRFIKIYDIPELPDIDEIIAFLKG